MFRRDADQGGLSGVFAIDDGHSDADYAAGPSVSGWAWRAAGAAFLYGSKRQSETMLCSASSELVAGSVAATDGLHARGLKDELTAAKGSIVNVTSIAGARVHPFAGAAYATSKAALAALTREMAHDFGPLGVRVNAIAPGEVETAILSPGTDKIVEKLPMQRLGQPKEVADVIWFLCSDQSSYISGAEIEVNGAQHV